MGCWWSNPIEKAIDELEDMSVPYNDNDDCSCETRLSVSSAPVNSPKEGYLNPRPLPQVNECS